MRATVIKESDLWGCPGSNFKANLPFNGMRLSARLVGELKSCRSAELQFFAALFVLFSKSKTDTFTLLTLLWKDAAGKQ